MLDVWTKIVEPSEAAALSTSLEALLVQNMGKERFDVLDEV